MTIKVGPGGLGPVKDAIATLERYHAAGLRACEIEFTYSIYVKDREDALKIGQRAKELGISLSIHAPYWINLNSKEKEKVEKSKQRILRCCEVGTWLGAKYVVFHAGYYSGMEKEEAYENIKHRIIEMQLEIKRNSWTPELAPELMGKVNVFGSAEEIAQLVGDTECSFCLDFAHSLARYKKYNFEEIKKLFGNHEKWHVHFSGIEYGEKGEKKHVPTQEKEIERLLEGLPRNKQITIISEAPNPFEDAVKIERLKSLHGD